MNYSGTGMRKSASAGRNARIAITGIVLLIATLVAPSGVSATKRGGSTSHVSAPAHSNFGAPVDTAIGDFNGDRELDVVEALSGSGLSIRWGISKGEFQDQFVVGTSLIFADRVAAADVNADGLDDLIAYSVAKPDLWIVVSDGHGGFHPSRSYALSARINDLTMGDFDRNGGLDLAVVTDSNQLVVLYCHDDRSGFELERAFTFSSTPKSIESLHIDDDGTPELVVGTADRKVSVIAYAAGVFSNQSSFALDFEPELMAVGDLDTDGWEDVVVTSRVGNVGAFLRVPTGLANPVVTHEAFSASKIELGFVDPDSKLDLVAVGSSISIVVAGQDDLRFASPRAISDRQGIRSFSLLKNTGHRSNQIVTSSDEGIEIETVSVPANKLRANFVVTNTADEFWDCAPDPMMDDTPVVTPAPAGSLRSALALAQAAGPDIITFAIPSVQPGLGVVNAGGFSPISLTWHIVILRPLAVPPETTIIGESQTDTNPFGPDIAIQPLNNTAVVAVLDPTDPQEFGPFDAFVGSAGSGLMENSTVSGLIVTGGNFGGFVPFTLSNCDPMDPEETDVQLIGQVFTNEFNLGSGNVLISNFIGTDQRGIGIQTTLPVNQESGAVFIAGSGNRVGGSTVADRNIIVSSNEGVKILNGSGNQILGNIIGTDGTVGGRPGGPTPLRGVFALSSTGTTISGNTIGGASFTGVLIDAQSNMTAVSNNRIGVDTLGIAITGNALGGVVVNASSGNTISGNIIAGTAGADAPNLGGVMLVDTQDTGTTTSTANNVVSDNEIRNNSTNGVYIDLGANTKLGSNTIGPNNNINTNSLNGVAVTLGQANLITMNSMTTNGGLGINLIDAGDEADGVTPNDLDDSDTGPNGLLNFPVFLTSSIVSNQVVVTGTAPGGSTVEIFQSDGTDRNGEGFTFLIETTAGADGSFTATLPVTLPLQTTLILTATATVGFNTSEFGPNFTLNQRVGVSVSSITFPVTAVGGSVSRTVDICNNGVSNLTIGSVTASGPPFSVTPPVMDVTLAPGECITVTVTYAPTAVGTFTGTLIIATDDPDAPQVIVQLGGTAVLATIDVNVTVLDIPQTRVGGTGSGVVIVSNPTDVPVTVTRIEFDRRAKKKVSFLDTTDPFFTAFPSTFTIPPNDSVEVQVFFTPSAPLRSPDLRKPFELPDPSYQTPKNLRTDMTLVVSDSLNINEVVLIRARVRPEPGITGGTGTLSGDNLTLRLNLYDPDKNIIDADFAFFNNAGVEITRVRSFPGIANALSRFAKGMNIPVTFNFEGLSPIAPSLGSIQAFVTDASGNVSNTIVFSMSDLTKMGTSAPEETPVLPPVRLGPIRR